VTMYVPVSLPFILATAASLPHPPRELFCEPFSNPALRDVPFGPQQWWGWCRGVGLPPPHPSVPRASLGVCQRWETSPSTVELVLTESTFSQTLRGWRLGAEGLGGVVSAK
jgi:hypothetical protein